jgi:N12 class adenine-specific DNA methylase
MDANTERSEALRKLLSGLTATPAQTAAQPPPGVTAGDVGRELVGGAGTGTGGLVGGYGQHFDVASQDVPRAQRLIDVGPAIQRAGAGITSAAQRLIAGESEAAQQAKAGFQPSIDFAHPLRSTLGPKPTGAGAALLGANLVGQALPIMAGAAASRGPTLPAYTGAMMGGGMAAQQEHERISSMSDEDIGRLPGYQQRLAAGMDPSTARADLAEASAQSAFKYTAPTGVLSALSEGLPVTSAGQKLLGSVFGPSRLARTVGGVVTAPVVGAAHGAAFGAAQELGAKDVTGETPDVGRAAGGMGAIGALSSIVPALVGAVAHKGSAAPAAPHEEAAAGAGAAPVPEAAEGGSAAGSTAAPAAVTPEFRGGRVHPTGEVEVAPDVHVNPNDGPVSSALAGAAQRGEMDRPAVVTNTDGSQVTGEGEIVRGPFRTPEQEEAEQQQQQAETAQKTGASVPFMITRAMRDSLSARGLDDDEIRQMTPAAAHDLLSQKIEPSQLDQILLDHVNDGTPIDGGPGARMARSLGVTLSEFSNARKRVRKYLSDQPEATSEASPQAQESEASGAQPVSPAPAAETTSGGEPAKGNVSAPVQESTPAPTDVRSAETVSTSLGDVKVNRSSDVPYLGSSLKDGTVALDKDWDPVIDAKRAQAAVDAVATKADTPEAQAAVAKALSGYDRTKPVVVHEKKEAISEQAGANYSKSHFDEAQPAEHAQLLADLGFKPKTPEGDLAIRAYEHTFGPDLAAAAGKKNPQVHPDLITKPYEHPHNVEQRKLLAEVEKEPSNASQVRKDAGQHGGAEPEKGNVPGQGAEGGEVGGRGNVQQDQEAERAGNEPGVRKAGEGAGKPVERHDTANAAAAGGETGAGRGSAGGKEETAAAQPKPAQGQGGARAARPVAPKGEPALPINPRMSPANKLRAIHKLTAQNKPIVTRLMRSIDRALGTKSTSNIKTDESILNKASRPSILAEKPWHNIEHVRDTFRFKTLINSPDQLPKIAQRLRDAGIQVVKVDADKMVKPKEWGWRAAVLDLRMKNGQLMEYYIPFKEMDEAKNAGNHELFEKWRNVDISTLTPEQRVERQNDIDTSRQRYDAAWEAALARSGSDDKAARAAVDNFAAIAGGAKSKESSNTLPVTAKGALADQSAEADARNALKPSKPNTQAMPEPESAKYTLSSRSDMGTSGESIAKPAETAKVVFTKNTIFTDEMAEKARARMRSKLSQASAGIDPEMLQDGIVLAGYHIEKGARTFAAYSKAMIKEFGEAIRPYLTSFYLAAKHDPRAAEFKGDMDKEDAVEAAAAQAHNEPTAMGEDHAVPALDQRSKGALEGVPAEEVQGTPGGGNVEPSAAGSRAKDRGGTAGTTKPGDGFPPSVGAGARAVSVSAGGKGGKPRSAGKRRVQADEAVAQDRAQLASASSGQPVAQGKVASPQFKPADFRIGDLALGEGGDKTKYQRNVAAIKLLNDLEQTGRHANPEEQKVLAQYVGWGGLPGAFDEKNAKWSKEFKELKELLSPEEYETAVQSTQYAHYTSPDVINGIYEAMRHLGFTGGRTLEAGSGVGNFIGLMPDDMRTSGRFTGVERERIAAGIAKHLYPEQNIQLADFTQFGRGEDGHYDANIGNPPFSSTTLADQSGRDHLSGLRIHNYFIAKGIDMLRDGGVMANVVSNGFMDAAENRARRYIGERAKFLGAIRLPNDAFKKNAGTEVTTDIVFFQKLPEAEWGGRAAMEDARRWLETAEVADPKGGDAIKTNRYFAEHPEMMLGEWTKAGSMYGPDQPALVSRKGQDTAALLREAVKNLPSDVFKPITDTTNAEFQKALVTKLHDTATVDNGGFYTQDGKLYQRAGDVAGEKFAREITPETPWTEKTQLGKAGFDRLSALADIRNTLRELLAAEGADNVKDMGRLRRQLNKQYDAYIAKNGYISDTATGRVYKDDPDYPLLLSLEHDYTPGMSPAVAKKNGVKPFAATAKKGPIFTKRGISNIAEPTKADSPLDAVAISIASRGKIDAQYIGKLLGKEPESVLRELATGDKPALFRDPATGEYVPRDAYLSGNVRKKLAQAVAAGDIRAAHELEQVLPEDVGAGHITAVVGSPWVHTDVYGEFAKHLLGEGTTADLRYLEHNSSFVGDIKAGADVNDKNLYGTKEYPASKLLMSLLNNRDIRVTYKDAEGNTHTDKEATERAIDKANDIKQKFDDWLFSDPTRAEQLVRAYNDRNNNYVKRQFDGSRLTLPGKSPAVDLDKQKYDFATRVVQDRTALADHVVGSGKTFSSIAAAMELKRTGIAKKNLFTVPNHLVKQWAAEFYRLYPGAKLLAATKRDFEKANRRKFLAKIATGDWDAVIMAHSSFGFIKPDPAHEEAFNREQIAGIMRTLSSFDKDEKDPVVRRTVKQLQKQKEALEQRIVKLRDKPMDNLLHFGQLGVDQLFVDEAHLFKNLMFSTKMSNIRGLENSEGSQRAYDMYLKTSQVMAKNGRDQGVVFLTGTPVSNSLAEMYHMMRYLMPSRMKEAGFDSFDAWANTFAKIDDQLRAKTAGGYKSVKAFSEFANTPELLKMFDQVSDVVTQEDLNRTYKERTGKEFPLPKLEGGRRQPVTLDMSDRQRDYMRSLIKRAEALEQRRGPPQKGEDNHLKLMSDARKAAIDIRLVNPYIREREPGGRIDKTADKIVESYKRNAADKGTQLVFADLGVPIKHAKKELKEFNELQDRINAGQAQDVQDAAKLGDEHAAGLVADAEKAQTEMDAKGSDWKDAIQSALRGFSVYDDLKAALVEKGIPDNEIAFIHDYNTDDQKAALFRKVNKGDIRVLVGSTEKMGAGTNVQERLTDLYHMDIPWRPSDIEQREGRIIRRGNKLYDADPNNFRVNIHALVTKDTLDKNMWEIQERKLRGINQLRSRNVSREIDNAFDEMEMSASEMQAAATGNKDLLREIQLGNDIKKMERRQRSFNAQKADLFTRKKGAEADIRTLPPQIEKAKGMADAAQRYTNALEAHAKKFEITIDGKRYTDQDKAGAYLLAKHDAKGEDGKPTPLDVEINGETYTNRSKMTDAFHRIRGDIEPIAMDVDGNVLRTRGEIAAAIKDKVSHAVSDEKQVSLGKIGEFEVIGEGETVPTGFNAGKYLNLVVRSPDGEERTGQVQVSTERNADVVSKQIDAVKVARDAVKTADGIVKSMPDSARYYQSRLDTAKKRLAEVEKTGDLGEWPDKAKLEELRAEHKQVLERIKASAEKPQFSKETQAPGEPSSAQTARIGAAVKDATKGWGANRPNIRVVDSAEQFPQNIKDADPDYARAKGAYDPSTGTIWIPAANHGNVESALRAVAHEAIGHYGVESILNDHVKGGWDKLAADIQAARAGGGSAAFRDVLAAVERRYPKADATTFAKETIAVMAERGLRNGLMARVWAAVRGWVRKLFPSLKFGDADLRALLSRSEEHLRAAEPGAKAPAEGAPLFHTESEQPFVDRATGAMSGLLAARAARAMQVNDALRERDLARGVDRAAWAQMHRNIGTADAAVDAFREHFDARPAAVRDDPMKAYEPIIAYQQKREIADPVARRFIAGVARMLDNQATQIRAFGEDKLGLLEQYFPQLWADERQGERLYSDMQAKRPLAGPKGFTKERVFADYEQGIAAGYKPKFDNPADALMARYQAGERYLAALKIRDGIDQLGLLRKIGNEERVPAGYARINDNTFNGTVVPELVAQDLNNYLAPGLSQFAAWRKFRRLENTLLTARLGFSAFHAGFTTFDAAATHLDLAFRNLIDRRPGEALLHIGKIVGTIPRALMEVVGRGAGSKLLRQFYGKEAVTDVNTAAVLDALTQGGARGKMDPTDYNNDFWESKRAWKRDGLLGLAKTPLRTLAAIPEAVMRPIANYLVPAQKMFARAEMMKYELDRIAGQLGQQRGDYAAITQAMHPDALRQIAAGVVQRVDDRLGQMAYDNLFWNRTVKDLMQASIQSVGWNVGTGNVILGGLKDIRKVFKPEQLIAPLDREGTIAGKMSRISGRLSYLIALNLGIGTLGAITQYMLTGQGPQSVYDQDGFHPDNLRDYFFPKTGNKNPDGTDARISFPSYVKDEYSFLRHPLETAQHKLHPAFSMIAELINNKDFYGNEVYNPEDPWAQVAAQVAKYIAGGYLPYAVQNQAQVAKAGGGIGARIAPFLGITPAPGDITHSRFQTYVHDRYREAFPTGGKTPEEQAQSQKFFNAVDAIRRGEQPDYTGMSPRERFAAARYAKSDPIEKHFSRLSLEDKLAAYRRATPAERQQYNLRAKLLNARTYRELASHDDETKDRLQQQLNDIRFEGEEDRPRIGLTQEENEAQAVAE